MSAQRYAVGVDVGGTKIAAAVVGPDGRIHRKVKVPTDRSSRDRSVAQVAESARQAVAAAGVPWEEIAAVGVAVPGIAYPRTGKVWCPNLPGWDQFPLRAALAEGLPRPVVVDCDRSAYVLGEQWMGAARGFTEVIFVAVGTGIGAGIISGGRLCQGAEGIAGAVGWFALNPEKKEIYKQVGCWEAESAGPGVARRAGAGDAETVIAAARAGRSAARFALEEAIRYLGMGIANLISVLNPQIVVLGGGLMQAGDYLLDPIRREVLEWAQPIAAQSVRIELTQLGEDAGLLGAARLALEDAGD
jgi:glucokinase